MLRKKAFLLIICFSLARAEVPSLICRLGIYNDYSLLTIDEEKSKPLLLQFENERKNISRILKSIIYLFSDPIEKNTNLIIPITITDNKIDICEPTDSLSKTWYLQNLKHIKRFERLFRVNNSKLTIFNLYINYDNEIENELEKDFKTILRVTFVGVLIGIAAGAAFLIFAVSGLS